LTQIFCMDLPGFRSREPSGTDSISLSGNMPLLSTYGQNRFEEFCIDFSDELVHSHVLRNIFDDSVGYNSYITVDGVTLPPVSFFTMVNAGCIELLHGLQLGDRSQRKSGGVLGVMDKASSYFKQGKGGGQAGRRRAERLDDEVGVHSSFIASPSTAGSAVTTLFGINHYTALCNYDSHGSIEQHTDVGPRRSRQRGRAYRAAHVYHLYLHLRHPQAPQALQSLLSPTEQVQPLRTTQTLAFRWITQGLAVAQISIARRQSLSVDPAEHLC